MNTIFLIGGGGHCHSCIDVIEAVGKYTIVGISDRSGTDLKEVLGYPIVGVDDDLPRLINDYKSAVITVGQIKSPNIRIRLFEQLQELGASLPNIISPYAHVSKNSDLGIGNMIMHGALINANVSIDNNCIVNSQALIEHDVVVEAHCHVATGAKINGGAHIEMGSFIGSGAVILQGVRIGERCVIGAGSVVVKDVPAFSTVRGII